MKLCALLLFAATLAAQTYTPAPENLKAREWFQNARFGMFIHWGVYSVLEDGEWVMNIRKMPIAEYEKLPARFNPTRFNAGEWVSLAKAAGMRYITITSKHHDGFAMFATKQNKWNIVDAAPFKRDPLKELAAECQKQGIKLFFYHSQLDWHHPDYFPRGRTGQTTGRPESGDFNRYLDFMDAQLSELLTNYGPIAGIWFDGMWDKRDANWRIDQTYRLIHKLQPAALVGSNHHLKPFPGEDFQMFEKDLPGKNTAGHSADSIIGDLPLETCDTINKAWGYNAKDKSLKSTKDLIQYVVRAAGYGANFLLNVGPKPDGTIQDEFVDRLRAVGKWMTAHGESIYSTRGGPVGPRNWGVTTQTSSKVYVHVLDWPDELLAIPSLGKVKNARLLNGQKVEMTSSGSSVLFRLPASRDEFDTILALDKE
ncbi:MAG TPA: alpha-L-fucosidase [Bryobacteraceae bacterium]|nr:alpha-L-fucosidase [Bryobacteraceae bacterium]